MPHQKNLFLLLILSAFAAPLLISSAQAEDITYDGTNPSMLTPDSGVATSSLFPSSSFSNNTVSVTGGTISGTAYGGVAAGADAVTNNRVILTGGTVNGFIYGGYSASGNTTNNSVSINGSSVLTNVVYGGKSGSGNASGNSVSLMSGAVAPDVYGGGSNSGNASGNSVNVSGGSVSGDVFGSHSNTGNATDNRVTISGGTVGYGVYGGHSFDGDTSGNSVTMTGGLISRNIYGGQSRSGEAANNSVSINDGSVLGNVTGGQSGIGSGDVTDNRVTISGGSVDGYVFGGNNGYSGNVTGNRVTITGGSVGEVVYGATSYGGSATGNSVTISDGSMLGHVVGGDSENGNVAGNSVSISGGVLQGDVYGGNGGSGNITGNSVTISGGSLHGDVIGGSSMNGNATGNHVSISGGANFTDSNFYGGRAETDTSATQDLFSANTLTLISWQQGTSTVHDVKNFATYNFVLPANVTNGATILTTTGTVDLTDGASINPRSSRVDMSIMEGGAVRQAGERFTLINAASLITVPGLNTTTHGVQGFSLLYDFDLAATATTLTATINSAPRVNPQNKSLSEAQVAGVSFINAGADFAADAGMANLLSEAVAISARKASGSSANTASNSFAFGALGGSSVRTETGSHVKVNGASFLAGIGVSQGIALGELTLGGFFETGKGNLSTHNSFANGDVNGSGDTRYTGVGVLAHLSTESGVYGEASLRAGKVKNEFDSDLGVAGQSYRYNTEATYTGLHLGVGKVFALNRGAAASTLDVYGKYFFTRQGSDDVTILGDKFDFDAVTSQRLRTGARYNFALNESASFYSGAAYEYELDGKANASVYGYAIDAPELKGGSGVLEIGTSVRPSKTMPLTLNVGLQGYVGQREGVAGQASLKYAF